jgi:hypothetical protein
MGWKEYGLAEELKPQFPKKINVKIRYYRIRVVVPF